MTQYEIIMAEGKGEITIEEANKRLKEIGSGIKLVDGKNTITAAELAENKLSDDPAKVTGWGHMAHGIGTPEKMHVKDGKFAYDTGFHGGFATFYIGDKQFAIDGDHITKM